MPARCLTTTPARDGRPRLFCFHHAGGSASVFRRWPEAIGADVQVLAVQLPGREERLRDTMPADMAALIADLDEHLDAELTEPFAFYGHSMGARIAHNLAERRFLAGATLPSALLVGASKAPHLPVPLVSVYSAPDQRLIKAMLDIGGLSPMLLNYPDWIQAALSLIRQDLRLCASETKRDRPPLPCPIHVFTGAADPLVSAGEAGEWCRYSSVSCAPHIVPGDHFFSQHPDPALVTELRAACCLQTIN